MKTPHFTLFMQVDNLADDTQVRHTRRVNTDRGARWQQWYEQVCGDLSTRRVASEIGKDSGYVDRNLKVYPPNLEAVLLFAHAFDRNPAEALIMAGGLTPGEILGAAMTLDLGHSTAPELIDLISSATNELRLRVEEAEKSKAAQEDSDVTSATPSATDTSQNRSVGSRIDGGNRRRGRDRRDNTADQVRRGFLG